MEKAKAIAWLKKHGFQKMEENNYANHEWNVVFEEDEITIANSYGDTDYLPGCSLYALVGYFTYHELLTPVK